MAKYTFANLKVEFDNSAGTLVDMSQHITSINGINISAELEDAHSVGDSWAEKIFAGLRSVDDITIGGFYDDTAATGPDVIFNDVGCVGTTGGTRTLRVTYGSTKTTSVETIIKSYTRSPARGEVTKFEAVLTPTGAVTET